MARIKAIGIVGAGTMGKGIAIACLGAGCKVLIYDSDSDRAGAAVLAAKKYFDKKNKDNASRILPVLNPNDLAAADLIIEAVSEDRLVKKKLLKTLDKICRPETIFATNTSTIPLKELARAISRKSRFAGMHFMNPAYLINLVEIVKTKDTSDETLALVKEAVAAMGKNPVLVSDSPGFVMNRLLIPMINEAVCCYSEGLASAEDIDKVMKIGAGHPMGPLALADLIGLDICLAILKELSRGFPKKNFKASKLLAKMVKAGKLGRKSGQGFYNY